MVSQLKFCPSKHKTLANKKNPTNTLLLLRDMGTFLFMHVCLNFKLKKMYFHDLRPNITLPLAVFCPWICGHEGQWAYSQLHSNDNREFLSICCWPLPWCSHNPQPFRPDRSPGAVYM